MESHHLALLTLLVVANGAPVVGRMVLGSRWRRPLDGGLLLPDGRRLLGDSKTIAGLLVALAATTALAPLLGIGWQLGLLLGAGAMLGDLASSLVKRRLGLASSAPAPGLDQVPEALLPLLLLRPAFELSWLQIGALTLGFVLANLLISRLMYHLGVRQHPQ